MAGIKDSLHKIYLDEPVKGIINNFKSIYHLASYQLTDAVTAKNTRLIKRYLDGNDKPRLHIGCGKRRLPGWLNSDYFPSDSQIAHVDATRRFPFADGSLHYIFTEHMIEHVSYENGVCMLRECYRTLVPGGRIRLATPDLQFLLDLYRSDKSDLQNDYIKWATDNHIEGRHGYVDTFVINNYVRDWGHLFIYDFEVLKRALEVAGFKTVEKQNINCSEDPILENLENESRMPPGFLKLESLIIEAVK